MNKVFNKFLLAGNNFMSEFHIRQLGFTFWSCSQIRGLGVGGCQNGPSWETVTISHNDEN